MASFKFKSKSQILTGDQIVSFKWSLANPSYDDIFLVAPNIKFKITSVSRNNVLLLQCSNTTY